MTICSIAQHSYCNVVDVNPAPKLHQLQVLLVETAVVGIGPFNRKWKGFEEKGLG